MTLKVHQNLRYMDVTHDLSTLIVMLLKTVEKHGSHVDSGLLRRAGEAVRRAGLSTDDAEFIQHLISRLESKRREEADWEDLAQAVRILAGTEFRLRQLSSVDYGFQPTPDMRVRFEELSKLLRTGEDNEELHARGRRHELIVETIRKRPGLYITEFYKYLRRLRAVRVTYATVWNDVQFLEEQRLLMTVGGPQGNPRYCFPHPDSIEDRRAYYSRYYCAEGVLEDQLTDRFELKRQFLDVFLLNSEIRPVFLVTKYGAIRRQMLGARIRTFGRLHGFDFLRAHELLEPVVPINPCDTLSAFSVAKVSNGKEETLWYDEEAFSGPSLYSGSITAAAT